MQPFGARAKEFVGDVAFAREVTVRVRGTDRYRRTLGEVILDGRNLGQEIVRAGLAWWYRTYAPKERALAELEREARAVRRGLWSEAGAVAPWEWRKPTTNVSR
jgi:endonuclease YncB( thermonuclease family)